jgi:LmbE family N-acetylglucosaminyl deacetylase
MRTIRYLFLLAACLYSFQGFAQPPATYNSADILLRLEKLKVLGSVLYVAAHPDDENTRLLAWLSKEKLYRTGYLSVTRGDGGQNLIGEEQGVALGMIRTQELLSARRIDGAEQFFTRAFDFGFSKSTEEAFATWNKEKVLSDVVWVIRNFKPDVIITRFPEDTRAGHGHHSGSAVLAREAFIAAADTTRFPEQFKYGVSTWRAKRILWNTFNFGNTNTTAENQFRLDVGVYNPLLGKSFGEIAAESRSQHKSQGFGVAATRGTAIEYFIPTGGEAPKNSLMDGIDTTWQRVDNGSAISQAIDQIITAYSATRPDLSVKPLTALYRDIALLKEGYWKSQKLKEVQQLIESCSGLFLEASSQQAYAVQGDSLRINISAVNRSNVSIQLKKVTIDYLDTSMTQPLTLNRNLVFQRKLYVNQDKEISQPYWIRDAMEKGSFNVSEQKMIGKPENPPAFTADFLVEIEGQSLVITRPVQYKHTDPVKGELYQPLPIVPPLTVNTAPGILLFRKNQNTVKSYTLSTTAYMDILPAKAVIHNRSNNAEEDKKDIDFELPKGRTKNFSLPVNSKLMKDTEVNAFTSSIEYKNVQLNQANYLAMASINYDHIPAIRYFYPDGITVLNLDIKTAGKKAGYIKGAGDKVPDALEQLGYEVTYLGEADMTDENLRKFDVIITGIRAYNIHEWLNAAYDVLMNYIKEGGTMMVQYNTNNFAGPMRIAKIGPYDFNISAARVTNEEAPVEFLDKDNPLLNWPNKISSKDFNGWMQERGIYFAEKWANEYKPVLAMKDPGETENRNGSLIMAEYGKGRFIYTGLVLFRQLPAAVPGAYRIFANLIANPKRK